MKEVLFVQKAKRAELAAWSNLDPVTKERAIGLFEIPKPPDDWNAKKVPPGVEPIGFKVSESISNLVSVFGSSRFIFDISDWAPNSTVNHGTHVIEHALQSALDAGGAPEISVNFGSCAVNEYKDSISKLSNYVTVLRLDRSAIEDSTDAEFFVTELEDLLLYLDIPASKLLVLVDYGDVTKHDELDMIRGCQRIKTMLDSFGFAGFSVAGSSVPVLIGDVVDSHFSDGKITRKEFSVWKALASQPGGASWRPANYGVRSAVKLRDFANKYANGKSKRTIEGGFQFFRGISKDKETLLCQHPKIAMSIVSGANFGPHPSCWGDQLVVQIANGEFSGGGHEQWISYDLNQHITFLVTEVRDFRSSVVTGKRAVGTS